MKNLYYLIATIILLPACRKDQIPSFDPVEVTLISSSSVEARGNITIDDESQLLALGICFDIYPNPTISNNKIEGVSMGNFTLALDGLLPNTTYYIRAFAETSEGILYGYETIFKTYSGPIATDVDGNVYNIITVGNQTWMMENLKVTHYNNGDPITNIDDVAIWNNLTSGAFCNYKNSNSYASIFGRLYNWYAVNDQRKLAPNGWHVATSHDWIELDFYLGGINSGGQLKETGTTHWSSPNIGATNSRGFKALPGGGCFKGQGFMDSGLTGNWWTSRNTFDGFAYFMSIDYDNTLLERTFAPMSSGFSVRCVKD